MRLRALRKSARSDVGQASDAEGLARRASAPKGSGASVSEESRSRVPPESGGGAGGAVEGAAVRSAAAFRRLRGGVPLTRNRPAPGPPRKGGAGPGGPWSGPAAR